MNEIEVRIEERIKLAEAKLRRLKKMEDSFDAFAAQELSFESLDPKLNLSNFNETQKEQVKSSEEQYQSELKNKDSNTGQWWRYFVKDLLEWSSETYRIFECDEEEGENMYDFYLNSIDEVTVSRFSEIIEIIDGCRCNSVMNQFVVTSSGIRKKISFSSFPMFDDTGYLVGVKGFVKDVTDEVNGEKGLDNFFNMSNDLHCVTHVDRYFVKVSPAWTELLGYSEEELLSQSYMNFIHPDDITEKDFEKADIDKGSSVFKFENRYFKKSGEIVYLSWFVKLDPETDLIYCTARDITESKVSREILLNKLSEKELLLREIHHRVKNNLQIITSLLSLQAGANEKEEHLSKLYEDSRCRIQSMAAIHEMFYESEELDKIEVGKYLNKLISDLSISNTVQGKAIEFSIEVELVYVNLDTAIPLGLIINEIVTNSIKYGGNNEGNVKISVAIENLENNNLLITIGDNGINSADNVLTKNDESLGIVLINSLVEQLDGEIIQMVDHEGTVFTLTFENVLNNMP